MNIKIGEVQNGHLRDFLCGLAQQMAGDPILEIVDDLYTGCDQVLIDSATAEIKAYSDKHGVCDFWDYGLNYGEFEEDMDNFKDLHMVAELFTADFTFRSS